MSFGYEALDSSGKSLSGVVDASSVEEATRQLHARGLFVTRLGAAPAGQAATANPGATGRRLWQGRPGNTRDLLMLAQQMTMMLRAGSRVVPALEAIGSQVTKPAWAKIIDDIREQVEAGVPLSGAVATHPDIFDEGWRAILAAGEGTGQIAEAFERISAMARQQQEVRSKLIGSIAYPVVLVCISICVLGVLMFFVLPRFDDLYTMLNTPLPALTHSLLSISKFLITHKLIVLLAAGAGVSGPILLVRSDAFRQWADRTVIHLPLLGKVARQIILARIFRIWGTAVRSNVALVESLELSRGVTRNAVYRGLMDEVIHTVEEGGSIGSVLMGHALVPRTMASAIATGEQSGQLGESLLFLAGYMEEENAQSLATLTRLIEPVILVIMGATVGLVAISLFLPLFDLTSATGAK